MLAAGALSSIVLALIQLQAAAVAATQRIARSRQFSPFAPWMCAGPLNVLYAARARVCMLELVAMTHFACTTKGKESRPYYNTNECVRVRVRVCASCIYCDWLRALNSCGANERIVLSHFGWKWICLEGEANATVLFSRTHTLRSIIRKLSGLKWCISYSWTTATSRVQLQH